MTFFLNLAQPVIELDRDIIHTNIQSKFEKHWAKNVGLKCKQDCLLRFDLLLDPVPSMIELEPNFIKTNIMSKSEKHGAKILALRM